MNNKKKIVISSIAACALLVSAFAFNSNASLLDKITSDMSNNPAQTTEIAGKAVSANSLEASTGVTSDAAAEKKQSNEAAKPSYTAKVASAKSEAEKLCDTAKSEAEKPSNSSKNQDIPPVKAANTKTNNIEVKNQTNNQQTTTNNIKTLLDKILSQNPSASCVKQPVVIKTPSVTTKPTTGTSKPQTTTKPAAGTNNSTTTKPAAGTSNSTGTANPASPTTTGEYSAFQTRVLELVNAERAKAGLNSLKMNTELSKVATLKSQDMAKNNYFDHNSPTYGSPFDMMKKFGISYRTAGENIAMGQTTPEQVMNGWMNSSGHRANILKASFTEIGIGIAKNSSGRLYWTQQFIG